MALQLVAFVLAAFTMVPGFSLIHSASSRGALRAARAGGMPYWYGYTPITAFQYPLNFTSGRLTHQNFGGQGPDAGDESLVFSNVGKVNGASFDMRLAASSGQTWQGNLSKTSLDNDAVIASFNMMSGTSTEVNVHFLDSVTKDPVIVPRFFLTVLDVDAGSLEDFGRNPRTSGGIESYRISHVKMFWVSSSHDINIQRVAHEEYNFTATEVGGVADNPTQALDLTEEQQNRAVMLEIRDRSWFQFAFAATPGTSNRNVMFSGPSQLGAGVPRFA